MHNLSDLYAGRLGRAHVAWTLLAYVGVAIVLNILAAVFTSVSDSLASLVGIVVILAYVAMVIFGIGVSVRRYHDLDWSGWLVLLQLIPFVGFVMLLIQLFKPGTPGNNRYGAPVPKDVPLMDALTGKASAKHAQGGTPTGDA